MLYSGEEKRGEAWHSLFDQFLPDVEFRTWPCMGDPDDIRYIATWEPIEGLAERFANLEVLFSTGAGVDQFALGEIPQRVQVVRLIDPVIVDGMREYVTMSVLALHRNLLDYVASQAEHQWRPLVARASGAVTVGVLGLGVLGRAVLDALEPFGYSLCAWSRTAHDLAGVGCYAGPSELYSFAARCDILVCLLPLTGETRGILDQRLFDAMRRGSGLVSVGRGAHLREDDLLAALDEGRLAGAVLDVVKNEPLPESHPFWDHERILLTPHIASMTGHESAATVLIDNIRRHQRGEPMIGLVDRATGY